MQELMIFGSAFGGGLASFLSPCVLPLVPPYLAFLGGASLDQINGSSNEQEARKRVIKASIFFVLGFTTVFVALGASATLIGKMVQAYSQELAVVAGVVIIIMGLHFLGVFRIAFLYREARVQVASKPPGFIGAYVIGLAFAFGWTPCIGPVLSTILAFAATGETEVFGATLLAVYSFGLGVPFVLAAVFSGHFLRFMMKFRRHMGTVERVMGVLLIGAGIMFLTGQMASMSYWLLETFPVLAEFG